MSTARRTDYCYFVPLATRWMDNDIYGHVNNVTYYSYFDTAANTYLMKEGGLDIHHSDVVGFVVASSCEYRRSIGFPDELDIGVRVNRLGNSSVEYGIGVFKRAETRPVAEGVFTHVFVSRTTQAAVVIPAKIRSALAKIQTTPWAEPD